MIGTWVGIATVLPGPTSKHGYPQVLQRDLADIKGEIKHSMAGSMSSALARLMGTDQASWTFSIGKDGHIYQHYSLEAITWHSGTLQQKQSNVDYIGVEHEGGPEGPLVSEPLTEEQYQATLALSIALRELMPHLGPPARATNLREHNEFAATACPSSRIPWERLIADLTTFPPDSGSPPLSLEARVEALETRLADLAYILTVSGIENAAVVDHDLYLHSQAFQRALKVLVELHGIDALRHTLPEAIRSEW